MRITEAELAALYQGPLGDLIPKGNRAVDEAAFRCNCARGNAAISARGDVFPRVSVPWTAGNVRQQPFGETWRSSPVFERIRGLKIADYPACAPCPRQVLLLARPRRRVQRLGQLHGDRPVRLRRRRRRARRRGGARLGRSKARSTRRLASAGGRRRAVSALSCLQGWLRARSTLLTPGRCSH